jgi:GTP-binding protein EngB required for normal cell division
MTKVDPVLSKLDRTRNEDFLARLDQLMSRTATVDSPATICVIGKSGIGKSTLINALVGGATQVVPAGGIGPLTAHALVIRHGDRKRLEVKYHGSQKLRQLIFALSKCFAADLADHGHEVSLGDDTARSETAGSAQQGEQEALELSEFPVEPDEPNDGPQVPRSEADASAAIKAKRAADYRAVAQLLVSGSQADEQDVAYLIAALQAALKPTELAMSAVNPAHRPNIRALQAALDLVASGRPLIVGDDDEAEFASQLRQHASGNLSPLVSEFVLHWPSPLLRAGIEFVDLPGTGIAGDAYQSRAREWMTKHARAVMVVVDHRGIDESVAGILHRTNFLNSLLYYSDDMPEGRPDLIAAVTKLDDIAKSERSNAEASSRQPIAEYFRSASERAIGLVRSGIKQRLVEASNRGASQADGAPEVSDAMARAIDNLIKSMEVHAVSAPDFRDLVSGDPEASTTLRRLEDTNIPSLRASLHGFAERFRESNRQQLAAAAQRLHKHVMSDLRVHLERWTGDGRADEATKEMKEKLRVFLEPLSAEFHRRQGQMKEFLDSTMPREIAALVDRAADQSSISIKAYLRRNLVNAHWGTLKAAVRRGGRYQGSSIDVDLPGELTKRFEDPIAELWGRSILEPIRRDIRHYANWCASVVEQIADWSKSQGGHVKPKLVQAQAESIKADATNLASVGAQMIRELRDDVKGRLSEAIERPIRKACDEFVERGQHEGLGTKRRILDLFDDLAESVRDSAKPTAVKTLRNGYTKVRKEIDAALRSTDDPITRAAEAIVESQESFTRRQDSQRRKHVVAGLEEALLESGSTVADALDVGAAAR